MTAPTFHDPAAAAFAEFLGLALDRYEAVVADCPVETLNWRPPAPETNSMFVLCVHAMGHLTQGVLGVLAGGPQERDRDAEFVAVATGQGLPTGWAKTREAMTGALADLTSADLARTCHPIQREPMTGYQMLAMMQRHTSIHEGHIELTRDLAVAAREETGVGGRK